MVADDERESKKEHLEYPALETSETIEDFAVKLSSAPFNWRKLIEEANAMPDIGVPGNAGAEEAFIGRLLEMHVRQVLIDYSRKNEIKLGVLDKLSINNGAKYNFVRRPPGGLYIEQSNGEDITDLDADFVDTKENIFVAIEVKYPKPLAYTRTDWHYPVQHAASALGVKKWADHVLDTIIRKPELGILGIGQIIVTSNEGVSTFLSDGIRPSRFRNAGGIVVGLNVDNVFLATAKNLHADIYNSRQNPGQSRR